MKNQERTLIGTLFLHHIYIVLQNTSSVHGLRVPDKSIWTALLLVFIAIITYSYLTQPASTWYEKSLYVSIFLSIGASLLRIFGLSLEIVTYGLGLIVIAILTTVPLIIHRHMQLKIALLSIYSLEIVLLISRVLDITNIVQYLGPLIEIFIVLGILYYNYALGFAFDELFVVVIFTITGWYLGDFVYSMDVPALVVSTLFEQTLSVGQFSIIEGIEPQFFLALHMAEVFNILIVQFLTRRSWTAMGIIIAGLDMTYPPLLALRALLILVFLRNTLQSQSQHSSIIKKEQTSAEPV